MIHPIANAACILIIWVVAGFLVWQTRTSWPAILAALRGDKRRR